MDHEKMLSVLREPIREPALKKAKERIERRRKRQEDLFANLDAEPGALYRIVLKGKSVSAYLDGEVGKARFTTLTHIRAPTDVVLCLGKRQSACALHFVQWVFLYNEKVWHIDVSKTILNSFARAT